MHFRVGPWLYRVRIAREVIEDDEGHELLGAAIHAHKEIQISSKVRPQHRREVVLHELRHAWGFHFPRPHTDEEECDFAATIMASMYEDLAGQGGIEALEALRAEGEDSAPPPPRSIQAPDGSLRPVSYVHGWESAASAHGGRAQCGVCCLIVGGGSIITEPVKWDLRAGGYVVRRTLYCPHCHHLQTWTEGASPAGLPNGAVADGPHYTRGRDVEQFLAAHPRAAGMIVE